MNKNNVLIQNIIEQFIDIQDQENWLDESFQKKIDQISPEQAFARPIPEIHSVAELLAHVQIWRSESIKKLRNEPSTLTVESPDNWRTNEQLKAIGWEQLKADFFKSAADLIELIKDKDDSFLENYYKDGYQFKFLIEGLIHHDLYHLGQIGITIKLLRQYHIVSI
ncbi:DinB family protein [Gynurincola endophyticus]|uniref:DinB family protein n=1 Tax=Gynurincola endophyticus TaxID=2479004 RepID=UPI000F8F3720|nr:DinB family protein [Gynurincola endophyticus]